MRKQDFEIKETDGKTVLIDKDIKVLDDRELESELRNISAKQSNILATVRTLKSEYDNLENKKKALKELINENDNVEDVFDLIK